jgi:hypothetical protein
MKTINFYLILILLSVILFSDYTEAKISGEKLISENPLDLNSPTISYTPLLNTVSTGSRFLNAIITDPDGVPTSGIGLPVLYWKINSGSWSSSTGSSLGGNNFQFEFGNGVVTADVVYYYIVAQDSAVIPNVGANPSGGAGGFTSNPPAASTPPTFPNNYTVTYQSLNGDILIGLTVFNKITNKNISFKREVKKVTKNVIAQNPDMSSKLKQGKINSKHELMTVEDIRWIPMENGKEYNGPLYILKSEHPELDFPLNITGIYATISAAISDLNFRGVNGPTRFLLDDVSYNIGETYPIVVNLGNANLTTPSNSVIIKPNIGVTSTISGVSDYNPVFRIISNYVTIDGSNSTNGTTRDLTISNTSTLSPGVISFTSLSTTPVTGSGIKNCNLINGINTSSCVVLTDFDFSEGYFNNITIQNNNIQNAYFGIYGASVTTSGSGLNISDNFLNTSGTNAIRHFGIYIRGFESAVISSNDVANFENSLDEIDNGIWISSGTKNTVIEKNKIYNLGYNGSNGYCAQGIVVSTGVTSANITVKNNVLYNIYGVGYDYVGNLGNNPMGIYLYGSQTGINVYNNSIHLYGNTLNLGFAMSIGICLGYGTSADIRNNNIVNNLGLQSSSGYGSCAIYAQSDNTQFAEINFNNYFVNPTGNGVKAIGKISTLTTSSTLSDWIIASVKDEFSISADPGFTSSTNLQPDVNNTKCWNVNAGAFPLSNVTTDINNNPRSTSVINGACDIGAYEFTPIVASGDLSITGNIIDGGISVISFAGTTLSTINWHLNGGTLPSSISAVFQPGVNPQNLVQNSKYANENFTISVPDGSGYLYDIEYKYNLARQGTITSENFIRLAKYSNTVWTQYVATPNIINKTVTVTDLNTFSNFTFGDESAPLPVNLSIFSSTITGRNVKLMWKTSSETNNAGFEIQRFISNDNSDWSKIGFIKGYKNKLTPTNYEFEDNNLNTGKYYYRLKQIDYNGNYEYYTLNNKIIIDIPTKFEMKQNYPNPFNPSTTIQYSVPVDAFVSLKVYDITGREIIDLVNTQEKAGFYSVVFNSSTYSLSSGIYFYRITAGQFTDVKKLMLIK